LEEILSTFFDFLMSIIFIQKPLSSLKKRGKINLMALSPKLKIIIIPALLVALFIILNLTQASQIIKNLFYLISSPIQKTFWQAGDSLSDFFEAISQSQNLQKENQALKLKIQTLEAEITRLQEFKNENEILREALGIGLEKDFKLALADISGKDIAQDLIFIDKGEKDGILEHSPVITQQKTLVGKVDEVYRHYSKVKLVSHPDFVLDVKISEAEIYGVLKGRGNLRLYLDFVPADIEIKIGEKIVTTPIGGIFPEGILAGAIKEVKKSDVQPFQMAEIEPAFDIGELKTLFIITEF